MPGRGGATSSSWGEGRNYVLVRTLSDAVIRDLLPGGGVRSWTHRWADGWVALIAARLMRPGEARPKSDGFSGYDWMVANILAHGDTAAPEPVR